MANYCKTLSLTLALLVIICTPCAVWAEGGATNKIQPHLNEATAQLTEAAVGDGISSTKSSAPAYNLSPVGRDIATQIGAMPIIDELEALDAQGMTNPGDEIKRLKLKQKLLEKVLIATLQVRDVVARVEQQSADLDRLSGFLEARRDRAIRLNAIANGIGGGAMNEIGQAGEMHTNEIPGEIVELIAGGVVTTLSALSLSQQSGGKKYVKPKANMLAKLFKLPVDADSEYPAVVWNYLNRAPVTALAPAPGLSPRTRLDELILKWQRYKLIGVPKDPRNRIRINLLTNTHPSGTVNIALLSDRIDMLADLRAAVYQLDRDLLELLMSTQAL